MQSVEAAAKAVAERVSRLAPVRVPLSEAGGRVLAADVHAARALPPFESSAMDGYAARSDDLPATLPVVGMVAAGQLMQGEVPPGVALRILTGAPLPTGLAT